VLQTRRALHELVSRGKVDLLIQPRVLGHHPGYRCENPPREPRDPDSGDWLIGACGHGRTVPRIVSFSRLAAPSLQAENPARNAWPPVAAGKRQQG